MKVAPKMRQPPRPPKDELHLEPQLKVKRLNRFAVLLAAIVGISVLWVAYFVLSRRQPISSNQPASTRPILEPERLAIERLRRDALERPEPPKPQLGMDLPPRLGSRETPAPPAPRTWRSTPRHRPNAPDPSASAAKMRRRRALDSEVLAAGFSQDGSPAAVESRSEPDNSLATAGQSPAPERLAEPTSQRVQFEAPQSQYSIQEGTLLPAILTSGIHSDLPGQTTALVRRNVYDSISGQHLLIPQGARLIGSYDHRIAWGQKRILMAWNRLILPDGRSLDLGKMPGADLAAMAGVRDKVNNHFLRIFGGALLLSAVSAGTQLSQPQESSDGGAPSARQIAAAALGQELGRMSAEVTRRNIDREPTLEIRPGLPFNIEVTADLTLPGPYAAGTH